MPKRSKDENRSEFLQLAELAGPLPTSIMAVGFLPDSTEEGTTDVSHELAELKPCPWCWRTNTVAVTQLRGYSLGEAWQIGCVVCLGSGAIVKSSREECVTFWNTRAPGPCGSEADDADSFAMKQEYRAQGAVEELKRASDFINGRFEYKGSWKPFVVTMADNVKSTSQWCYDFNDAADDVCCEIIEALERGDHK